MRGKVLGEGERERERERYEASLTDVKGGWGRDTDE